MPGQRYFVVEGLPGAGKTALARALATAIKGRLVEDPAAGNPFLGAYREAPAAHAFSLQVFSLLARFRQQQELAQGELFGGGMVADYLFDRDRIYAHLTLGEAELGLYQQLLRLIGREPLPAPDAVVYLQASVDTLLERRRAAAPEGGDGLSRESLAALGEAYNHFFFHYTAAPLLVVGTNDLGPGLEGALDDIVERALRGGAGTQYYTPKR